MSDPSVLTLGELREPAPVYGDPPGLFLILSLAPFRAVDLADVWSEVPEGAVGAARPLSHDEADQRLEQRTVALEAARAKTLVSIAQQEADLQTALSAQRLVALLRRPTGA